MAVRGIAGQRSVPTMSVLIPAFNEAAHIGTMLDDLAADPWVKGRGDAIEVIVVDDGSSDDTAKIARSRARSFSNLSVLSLERNLGKGAALARGIEQSKGNVVAFVDGDHTFDFEALPRFLDAIEAGADVVVGDRRDPGSIFFVPSQVIPYIHLRHFVGQRFNTLVRLMTDLKIADTQCGFKMFTQEAAKLGFSRIKVGGFVFDVEVLLAVQQAGYRIEALPVRLRYDSPEPVWETLGMSVSVSRSFMQVLRARIRGHYRWAKGVKVSADTSDEPRPKLARDLKRES